MTQEHQRVAVSRLNDMLQEEFVAVVGQVFEHAPWVAANAWSNRPFDTLDHLHETMLQTLKDANREDQLKFLRRHTDMQVTPELISNMQSSSQEKSSAASPDKFTDDDRQRIAALVSAYQTRFGFPFIAAIQGRSVTDILGLVEQHLGNDSTDMELYFTFSEVGKITRIRLEQLAV
ncbi:MAG: 2-oxo-4-hydroxy-4-carboxy-5-ureidoimidazoline decarboxylase [Dehalococcoidia bacterium]